MGTCSSTPPPIPSNKKKKCFHILIAMEHPQQSLQMAALLSLEGHKVTAVSTGEHAIRAIKQHWLDHQSIYQVIIIDLHLTYNNTPCSDIIKTDLEDEFADANGMKMPSLFVIGVAPTRQLDWDQYDCDKVMLYPFSIESFRDIIRCSRHLIHYKTRFCA